MSTSSLLRIERPNPRAPGHDGEALGPSDSSDSGSDMTGVDAPEVDSDSDSAGTGERRSAAGEDGGREADDIAVDRVFSPLGDDDKEGQENQEGAEDESADPVGDGHADAAFAASLPPRPDRPNPEPDPAEDTPPGSPDGDMPPADDGGEEHHPGREPALLGRRS